jgi:6-pyruvoyltetrahydropterin/6-carboxytetrahydropterin synthase
MFEISKVIEFSAAHSVYSQKLNPKWAKNTYPKCRRLPGHGHNYKLIVYLKSEKLDEARMVTDFGHLGWLKEFIDTCFDHKTIFGMDDPSLLFFLEKLGLIKDGKFSLPNINGETPSLKAIAVNKDYKLQTFEFKEIEVSSLKEFHYLTFDNFKVNSTSKDADFYQRFLDGIALFNGSPTSENFARFFYYFVSKNVEPLGVECSKVSIFETEKSCATYEG